MYSRFCVFGLIGMMRKKKSTRGMKHTGSVCRLHTERIRPKSKQRIIFLLDDMLGNVLASNEITFVMSRFMSLPHSSQHRVDRKEWGPCCKPDTLAQYPLGKDTLSASLHSHFSSKAYTIAPRCVWPMATRALNVSFSPVIDTSHSATEKPSPAALPFSGQPA